MATLIPALGACLPRMTSGEKRLAERLPQKTTRLRQVRRRDLPGLPHLFAQKTAFLLLLFASIGLCLAHADFAGAVHLQGEGAHLSHYRRDCADRVAPLLP